MKFASLFLFFFLISRVSFGQTSKSENCACNCSYNIIYADSLEGKELALSGYKYTGVKPKEAKQWTEEFQFSSNSKITVTKKGLSSLLDKVCHEKTKGTLLIQVKKEGDLDYATLLLGRTNK